MVIPAKYLAFPGGTGMLKRVFRAPDLTAEVSGIAADFEQWAWLVVETGTDGWRTDTLRDMGVHILHAGDESDAWLDIEGRRIAVHPGDSVLAYTGNDVAMAPNMIVVVFIGSWKSRRRRSRATHGEETFVGYNRRTTYDETRHMAFDRWKLTQPISFASAEPCPLLCIFGSLTVTIDNEIFVLRPGQAIVFVGGLEILPDGLAYAMTIWDPEYGNGVVAETWSIDET